MMKTRRGRLPRYGAPGRSGANRAWRVEGRGRSVRATTSGVWPGTKAVAAAALASIALAGPALAADGFATDWAAGLKDQARLVAAGEHLAGFQIRLAPGAITYWRDPGDAGLPPTFDFSGSVNVASVEPVFPAPTRIREADGGVAFGYEGGVIFPLRVEPRDVSKPVTLALHANFAVCEKVCLPAEARLRLTLTGAASPYAGKVEAALAAAPRAIGPEGFGDLAAADAKSWRLCAPARGGAPRDLFVEPPSGWWLTTTPEPGEAGKDCFKIALRDKPADAAPPVALRLTLTGGAGPIETTMQAPALR